MGSRSCRKACYCGVSSSTWSDTEFYLHRDEEVENIAEARQAVPLDDAL
jgi:hypothetical protein